MTPFRLLALLALVLVTPATAQMSVPRIQPIQVQPVAVSPQGADAVLEPWMTPETAKRAIEQLRAERTELKASLADTNTRLAEAIAKIDEMTKSGGTLVKAYCASSTVSRNTAGAEEDCAAGGYRCDQVTGLCHRRATHSLMCSTGFNWDANTNQCIT
jgi:hypothetical protein